VLALSSHFFVFVPSGLEKKVFESESVLHCRARAEREQSESRARAEREQSESRAGRAGCVLLEGEHAANFLIF